MTIHDVKRIHEEKTKGHFFSRETMKFFKDTMKNLGVYKDDTGRLIVYRKHGRQSHWAFNPENGEFTCINNEFDPEVITTLIKGE